MRGSRVWRALNLSNLSLLVFGASTAGCSTPRPYDTRMPYVEEFRQPPDEERFNNPEEKEYKAPPPKKDFKPGFGGGAGPSPGGFGGH